MRYKYAMLTGIVGLACISIAQAETAPYYIKNARKAAERAANIEFALLNLEAEAYGIKIPKKRDAAHATVKSTLIGNRIALKAELTFVNTGEISDTKETRKEAGVPKVVEKEFNNAKTAVLVKVPINSPIKAPIAAPIKANERESIEKEVASAKKEVEKETTKEKGKATTKEKIIIASKIEVVPKKKKEETKKEKKKKEIVKEIVLTKTIPSSSKGWAKLGLNFNKAKVKNGKYVQRLKNGWEVEYTVKPKVQKRIKRTLVQARARRASVVLLDPKTGAVEAMVGVNENGKLDYKMTTKSDTPSASVFKIITATALLDEGYRLNRETCYHGGRSYLSEGNILGDKRKDYKCATLTSALAFSINSIIAKLAYRSVSKKELQNVASRFAYNQKIPFEFSVQTSRTAFPSNRMERARAAAGFRHTKLSPLHASMIGASIANRGKMMQPHIIRRVRNRKGKVIYKTKTRLLKRVTSSRRAESLWLSMRDTTTRGTARKYFRPNTFRGIASGKTGTLSDPAPYTQYSWFAGSAERNGKRIAVAALLCNSEKWHIKGGYAASDALKSYFASR